MTPTADDIRNGWTPQQLESYRLSRERAHGLVGGLVVTDDTRIKKRPLITEGCFTGYSPFKWRA